jgi:2-hydroxymuconate-semialdehyde hydrolase
MRRLLLALVALAAIAWLPPLLAPALGLAPDPGSLPERGRAVAIAGGLELNVVEAGSGAPVVLVHGLPSNVGDWGPLPEALASRGLRAIAYDRIGYGWSSRAPVAGDAYTFASSARELGALLDALGIERAALVGWSYGGGVVQTLAADAPERVAQLVLIGSVGPAYADVPRDAVGRVAGSPLGVALFRWVGSIPPLARATTGANLAEMFSGAEHVPAGFLERTRAQLALPGTLEAFAAESERLDARALAPERIAAPALVVHGDDDRGVPLAVAEDLEQRLPQGELLVFSDGSHMLPVTHAERLADALAEWLARTR